MTETSEQAGGFDRRSLIKKGLVIGGAATVLPVISTFNAPAFAASAGTFRIHYNITTVLGIVSLAPRADTPTACGAVAGWAGATPDPGSGTASNDILIGISGVNTGLLTADLTFALQGDAAGECTFIEARWDGNSCQQATGLGSTSVTFPSISNALVGQNFYLIVNCTV